MAEDVEKMNQRRARAAAWAASRMEAGASFSQGSMAVKPGESASGNQQVRRTGTGLRMIDMLLLGFYLPPACQRPRRTTVGVCDSAPLCWPFEACGIVGSSGVEILSGADGEGWMQVEECERIAAELAQQSSAKMSWVSGGIALGSKGADEPQADVKRQKISEHDMARPGGFLSWANELTSPHRAGVQKVEGSGTKESAEYGWKTREGGLQSLAESFGGHNSAGARQEDMERMLEDMDEDYRLPRNHQPQGYIDMSRCEMASMEKPIPESNNSVPRATKRRGPGKSTV